MSPHPASTSLPDADKTKEPTLSELPAPGAHTDVLKESRVKNANIKELVRKGVEEELHRATRALRVLSGCKEAMIRADDEAVLLNDVCKIIVTVGGYRMAWIGFIENDTLRTIRPAARAGYDEGYVDNLSIALEDPVRGNGPTGISLKTGKPYESRDVRSDAEMEHWREEALKRGYLSTLNLPIVYEKQVIGALVIYSGKVDAFDEEERGLLFELAQTLAYGITAIRGRARLTKAEEELQRVNNELEKRVAERTEELANARMQAELYLDLMGHDINNMNQSAMGFLELAKEIVEGEGKLDAKDVDLLDSALSSINNSSLLISNVRKLQRARSGEYKPEVYDLGLLIEEVAGQFKSVPGRYVNITSGAIKGVHVQANGLLKDVFVNLIDNAIKHSAGPAFINIRMVRENKMDGRRCCTVTIEDNGPGIPGDMKDRIFDRLRRGDTKAKGSGLGLYLVKSLVESYGGHVWVVDRVKGDFRRGARFVVLLPAVDY